MIKFSWKNEEEVVKTTESILEEMSFKDLYELREKINAEYYKRMIWEN